MTAIWGAIGAAVLAAITAVSVWMYRRGQDSIAREVRDAELNARVEGERQRVQDQAGYQAELDAIRGSLAPGSERLRRVIELNRRYRAGDR